MLKRKPVQGPLYSFFGGKQSSGDKEIIKNSIWNTCFDQKNMQVLGGMEG